VSAPARVDDLRHLIFEGERFATIYVDPPWKYGNQATRNCTDRQYRTMTLDEIAALPIPHLAEDNAHLWVWTTVAFHRDTYALLEHWGLTFKSEFVWVKPQMGMGNYLRLSHEYLMLGIRGKLPVANHSTLSWASYDRSRHSAKPPQVRAMVESLSPGPRLELFARELVPGWTVYGDQVPE
jgi:N6-adenosine-specific RNA methylase IME4